METIGTKEINDMRRGYSLYILSDRAIPHVTDGLKASSRRVLWKARDGKKIKSATLGGATMSIHPHAMPESAINTLAGFYTNNIPLLEGFGAFGTLLEPKEFGASRYTHVKLSLFAQEVLFKDKEIIPMVDNYDSTEMEPKHYLPLIPIVLLNPQEGMADGFASNIHPRSLRDIINAQLQYLSNGKVVGAFPKFKPLDSECTSREVDKKGVQRWRFSGEIERVNTSTLTIKKLPYGMNHAKLITKLDALVEKNDDVSGYEDNSSDYFDITVKFKRGYLAKKTDEQLMKLLDLEQLMTENMNVIDFNSTTVYSATFEDIIQDFSEWRLHWYSNRYKRLRGLLEFDIQRMRDVITAIDNDASELALKVKSRDDLITKLKSFGIISLDYIADLGIYRFTKEERQKTEAKLNEALVLLAEYNSMIKSKDKRKSVYIEELTEVLKRDKAGKYASVNK